MNEELIKCRLCQRLVKFRVDVADRPGKFKDEKFWSRPVPGHGDPEGRILILGLAPAATGGNRTGRVFTGDKSSEFLVSSLYEVGLSNMDSSESRDDGLQYIDTYVSAALKCVPPLNKPAREELENCSRYLDFEIDSMKNLKAVLVLGRIAYDSFIGYLKRRNYDVSKVKFAHGSYYDVARMRLYCSYHPSPRNVNTGKMSKESFTGILRNITSYLETLKI